MRSSKQVDAIRYFTTTTKVVVTIPAPPAITESRIVVLKRHTRCDHGTEKAERVLTDTGISGALANKRAIVVEIAAGSPSGSPGSKTKEKGFQPLG
jgi:hypothetical protein